MGNDSIVYIRTDGNDKIATGHFVRCLCIAQALEELGKKVYFLVSDTTSFSVLRDLCNTIFREVSFSFTIKILESAVFNNLEAEVDELCSLLSNNSYCNTNPLIEDMKQFPSLSPLIVVDSYYVTPLYFQALGQFAKVAYIDDLRSFDYNVDLVINYDVIPSSYINKYKQFYTKAKKTLLGAQYTPLRKQFQNPRLHFRENFQNILITTGGSDPYDFTTKLATYLISQEITMDTHIVVGKLFNNISDLETLAAKYSHIYLHKNISNMAALMEQCDFAISTAGTTLYELCSLGIPSISIAMSDNQVLSAKAFAEINIIPYAGDIRTTSVYSTIFEYLTKLSTNKSLRYEQMENMHKLVDGTGAIQIVQNLISL